MEWQVAASDWFNWGLKQIEGLANPWTAYQIGVIIVTYWMAIIIARSLSPTVEGLINKFGSHPRVGRVLRIPLERFKWIIFASLLLLIGSVMQAFTLPSRSIIIWIAASLATAWVVISIASRFIKNPSLSKIFALTAWSLAALNIMGFLDQTLVFLDQLAFSMGDFRLSLLMLFKGMLIFGILLWLASASSEFAEDRIRKNADISPTLQVLFSKVIKVGLMVAAIAISFSAIGIDLTALKIFSGALGLGIGFGLQKVVSNLLSGIIILLDRSIKPGDVISLGDTFGWITSLKARYVSVVTRNGVEYLIPNEDFITREVINWSFSNRRVRLEVKFGVSYDSDPHEVRKLVADALLEVDRVLTDPAPVCHVIKFGDSSVDFVARIWMHDPEKGLTNLRGQVFLAIWDALRDNNIGIPYPHREVIMRNAE